MVSIGLDAELPPCSPVSSAICTLEPQGLIDCSEMCKGFPLILAPTPSTVSLYTSSCCVLCCVVPCVTTRVAVCV